MDDTINRIRKLDNTKYYFFSNPIGKGATSTVFKGFYIENDVRIYVAIKLIDLIGNENHEEYTRNEIDVLSSMTHDNIIKYIDSYEKITDNKHDIYIIMEYVNGLELTDYLLNNELNTSDKIQLIRQIINAVDYMHTCKIMHRDIKPSNIMIDISNSSTHTVKLIDLGFSVKCEYGPYDEFNDDNLFETICGTPAFMAPEILLKQKYSYSADMWSIGVLIYFIDCGVVPFHQCKKIRKLYEYYKNAEFPINMFDQGNDPIIIKIVNNLLIYEKDNRYTCKDLLVMLSNVIEQLEEQPNYKQIITSTIDTAKSLPIMVGTEIQYKSLQPDTNTKVYNSIENIDIKQLSSNSSLDTKSLEKRKLMKKCSSNYLDEYDCIDDIDEYENNMHDDYLFYKQNLILIVNHTIDILDPVIKIIDKI